VIKEGKPFEYCIEIDYKNEKARIGIVSFPEPFEFPMFLDESDGHYYIKNGSYFANFEISETPSPVDSRLKHPIIFMKLSDNLEDIVLNLDGYQSGNGGAFMTLAHCMKWLEDVFPIYDHGGDEPWRGGE
jgi:hypothetical protein